jgi:hypothetical protein
MKFKELRQQLSEAKVKSFSDEETPATVLVLRRQGIRVFPDGRRVALYTNQHYNLVFTIPFYGKTPGRPVLTGMQAP